MIMCQAPLSALQIVSIFTHEKTGTFMKRWINALGHILAGLGFKPKYLCLQGQPEKPPSLILGIYYN